MTATRRQTRRDTGKRGKGGKDQRPSEHAREALQEWGKAIRFGALALAPRLSPKGLKSDSTKKQKGGRVGDAADALLSKLGTPGKLASKASLGSRALERLTPGSSHGNSNGASASNGHGSAADMPVPIQEAIEVAVPLRAAYALATRFADYPEFLDRVESVELLDDGAAAFEAKVHGAHRTVTLEIVDEQREARIEWRITDGLEYLGVASFHELAPSLTHIEISVEPESESLIQRFARSTHLTQHAIRLELQRFKAYAELWQEEEDVVAGDAEAKAPDDGKKGDAKKRTAKKRSAKKGTAKKGSARKGTQDKVANERDEDEEPPEDEDGEDEQPEEDGDDSAEPEYIEQPRHEHIAELAEPPNAYSDVLEDYQPVNAYPDVLEGDEDEVAAAR